MIAFCQHLHQAVFAVFLIEPECKPYQNGGGDDSEADADPVSYTHLDVYKRQVTNVSEVMLYV